MEPMSPEVRARLIAADPKMEAELEEYEQLLGQRFSGGPGGPVNPRIGEIWEKIQRLTDPLGKPFGLTPAGELAYATILEVLTGNQVTGTNGRKVFYAPEQWAKTGSKVSLGAILIVVYEGSNLAPHFNIDVCSERYRMHPPEIRFETYEEMRKALKSKGFRFVDSLGYFSTVYEGTRA